MVRLARSLYCHDNYCTGHPNSRLDRHGTDRDHLERSESACLAWLQPSRANLGVPPSDFVSARLAWQTESATAMR